MKKLLFVFIFIFYAQKSNAQTLDYGNDLSAIKICNEIQGNNFLSESEADSALDKILDVIGASKRFVLQPCDNINNAIALSFKGVRYIMYDPEFMQMLSYSDNWSNMFVLAHEVGHHINGHSVDAVLLRTGVVNKVPLSKKRIQELEADKFAGFVLGRLGATLSDATSAVSKTSDGDDSYSTHPRRSKRIAAITKGFNESGGAVNSNLSVKKGKIIDSPYSNFRFYEVKYVRMDYWNGVYTGYVGNTDSKPFGYGEYRSKYGNIYEGEWSGGQYNGYGKKSDTDGSSYEGYFVNNKESGEGILINEYGKYVGFFSDGNFVRGLRSGKDWSQEGTWNRGSVIKVTFKSPAGTIDYGFLDGSNGNGYGERTFINGSKLNAVFKEGTMSLDIGMLGGKNGSKILTIWNKIKVEKWDDYLVRFVLETQIVRNEEYTEGPYSTIDFIPKFLIKRLNIKEQMETPFREYISKKDPDYNERVSTMRNFIKSHNWRSVYNKDFSESKVLNSIYYDTRGIKRSHEDIVEDYGDFVYMGDVLGYGEMEWVEPSSDYIPGTADVTDQVNGTYYEGYFNRWNFDRAGYGEIFYGNSDKREYYKGIWWDDKKNGYGILKYKDGKIEKGIFSNDTFYRAEDFDFGNMQRRLSKWLL